MKNVTNNTGLIREAPESGTRLRKSILAIAAAAGLMSAPGMARGDWWADAINGPISTVAEAMVKPAEAPKGHEAAKGTKVDGVTADAPDGAISGGALLDGAGLNGAAPAFADKPAAMPRHPKHGDGTGLLF
jgi:hypothetical protein